MLFGPDNLGDAAISGFLQKHSCRSFCRRLGLAGQKGPAQLCVYVQYVCVCVRERKGEREIVNIAKLFEDCNLFCLNQYVCDLHPQNIQRFFFCGILVLFFSCARVYMHAFVCHLCVVTQEANVGSEINPQQLQMKTTHTNSQLIKPRVFVYSYNNSSV